MIDPSVSSFLSRQRRLFEATHREPTELKSLGFSLRARGIDLERRYCNPELLSLPWAECEHLRGFTPEQVSRVTAAYFANFYAQTATNETYALDFNKQVSALVFPLYSDDYMVLFEETDEEYDHIICFSLVNQALLGRSECIGEDKFPAYKLFPDTLRKHGATLCKPGYGALFLLYRYILNLVLKQTEAYMFAGLPREQADPLALGINEGHLHDEARHLTTSIELGSRLFAIAEPSSRAVIQEAMKLLVCLTIERRFATDSFRSVSHELGAAGLRLAMAQPNFGPTTLDYDGLVRSWRSSGLTMPQSEEVTRSKKWIARQIRRLLEVVEIDPKMTTPSYEQYLAYLQG
jgi:hypothetical protein